MTQKPNNPKLKKQGSMKLTLLLILLPLIVIILMVVFWQIFQETRKHPVISDLIQYESVVNLPTDKTT